jgi:phosphoglycolate phosphatase
MPQTLIFDLDGTISNPFAGIHNSVNYALDAFGHPRVAAETFHHRIGPPIDHTFVELVPGSDPKQVLTLVAKYRERYAAKGYAENELYPDMPDILLELKARGYRLGVCTSKRVDFAEKILQMFELDAIFDFIDGGDVGINKQQQLKRLRENNVVPQSATMIGDRNIDVSSAHANGLEAIGVLWGFGSHAELEACGTLHIAATPQDLLELLK